MSEFNPWRSSLSADYYNEHLALFRALTGGKCIYISGQMTSGIRESASASLIKVSKEPGALKAMRRALNDQELRYVRDVLQAANPYIRVIAPCELDEHYPKLFEEWKQDDFNLFWRELIIQIVDKIYLTPNWQYSRGGVWEAYVALYVAKKPCYEFESPMVELTQARFVERLEQAHQHLQQLGVGSPSFKPADLKKVHGDMLDHLKAVPAPATMLQQLQQAALPERPE